MMGIGLRDNASSLELRRLSEGNRRESYAVCWKCKEVFLDDLQTDGSIVCPNICGGVGLHRGFATIEYARTFLAKESPNAE